MLRFCNGRLRRYSSSSCLAASCSFDVRSTGSIRATARPRDVTSTVSPVCTSRRIFEKCRLASEAVTVFMRRAKVVPITTSRPRQAISTAYRLRFRYFDRCPAKPCVERAAGRSPVKSGISRSVPGPMWSSEGLAMRVPSPARPFEPSRPARPGRLPNFPASRSTSPWRGHGIGGNRELGRLEALELVAQARGFLEVEVGGGGAHALLEIGHHGLQVMADGGAALGEAGVDADMVALVDRSRGCRRCRA